MSIYFAEWGGHRGSSSQLIYWERTPRGIWIISSCQEVSHGSTVWWDHQDSGGEKKPTLQLVKEEVASYKAVDCISLDSNLLVWWMTNESTYPRIVKLAKRYLAVPATSVPSERIFSTAVDIVTASRSSLSVDSVDKLVFSDKKTEIWAGLQEIFTVVL